MLSLHSAPEKLLSGSFSILGSAPLDVKLSISKHDGRKETR
jgi:hypothetical protein